MEIECLLFVYQPDWLYHTVMTHIHTPYLLNHLGIDGLALVRRVMVLSGNRTIHHDTALVNRQRPLVLYCVVLATNKKREKKKHRILKLTTEEENNNTGRRRCHRHHCKCTILTLSSLGLSGRWSFTPPLYSYVAPIDVPYGPEFAYCVEG